MISDKTKDFKAGDLILKKGDEAVCAYMIKSGRARVFVEEGSRQIDLAILEEGAIFGETAIFDGGVYGANIMAEDDCKLLVITPDCLQDMLEESDPVLRALLEMLIKRLKDTNEALVKSETREFMDVVLI